MARSFTLNKTECSWQLTVECMVGHGIMKQGFGPVLLVSRTEAMINRDGRGHSYYGVRGEILGSS